MRNIDRGAAYGHAAYDRPPSGGERTPLSAAYQGRPGAYSESAARALIGVGATLVPCATLEETFDALTRGDVARAVVPVENTLAGSVTKSYDLLLARDVAAVGEHVHHVDHVLIARRGTTVERVVRVLSHPVALAQCERFFQEYPHVAAVPVFDTAGAVPMALSDPQDGVAAIASREAARIYGGAIIAEHLQDHAENFTRFLLLKAGAGLRSEATRLKGLLAFGLPNVPAALWSALEPFAHNGINLTKIESRPVAGRPFEYAFIVEIEYEGSGERAFAEVRRALETRTTWLRVIGTFAVGRARSTSPVPAADISPSFRRPGIRVGSSRL